MPEVHVYLGSIRKLPCVLEELDIGDFGVTAVVLRHVHSFYGSLGDNA